MKLYKTSAVGKTEIFWDEIAPYLTVTPENVLKMTTKMPDSLKEKIITRTIPCTGSYEDEQNRVVL